MDSTLSDFITQTGADPGLARDILNDQQWNLQKALQAFYYMKGLQAAYVANQGNSRATAGMQPSSNFYRSSGSESGSSWSTTSSPNHRGEETGFSSSRPPSSTATACTQSGLISMACCNPGMVKPNTNGTPLGSPVRPLLKKSDAVEIDDLTNKKLSRGISRATDNVNLVSKARNEFALGFRDSGCSSASQVQFFVETPVYTFTLPDLTIYSDEFRAFLEKDLIEMSTLVSLEQAGRLNWWAHSGACQRLWPLCTTGDGNCLLHAASLGMWGFHDRLLTLRKALHATLTNGSYRSAIWRRWRWQQTLQNKEAGLVYCEEEWQREWENLLRLSSTEPRSRPGRKSSCCDSPATKGILDTVSESEGEHDIYESLEEIHVLALAHVLRRPIIIVADTMLKDVTGEPFAPIPFGGIYLPLECTASECHRSPLVLTYDAAHFSALVAMEKESYADKTPQPPAVIPLTDPVHQLLPIQFAVDPGHDFIWGLDELECSILERLKLSLQDKLELLHEYLDLARIPIPPDYCSVSSTSVLNGHSDDKKSSSGSFESDDSTPSGAGDNALAVPASKNKAAKQLQSVAKQFGSIGRTMSKKLKKNLGTLSRIGRSNSFKETSSGYNKDGSGSGPGSRAMSPCNQPLSKGHSKKGSGGGGIIGREHDHILSAALHTEKRHEYQEEMIRNYLHTAHERFERELRRKQQAGAPLASSGLDAPNCHRASEPLVVAYSGPTQCVNPGCVMFGTAATSYLCSDCYVKQKQEEQHLHQQQAGTAATLPANTNGINGCQNPSSTLYGAGKSRFYADSDSNMFATIAKMPVTRRPSPNLDRTLFLSKSTFYNDAQASVVAPHESPQSAPKVVANGSNNVAITAGQFKPSSCCSNATCTTTSTSTVANNVPDNLRPTSMPPPPPPPCNIANKKLDADKPVSEGDRNNAAPVKQISPTELNHKNFAVTTTMTTGSNNLKHHSGPIPQPCKMPKCQFYGSEDMDFLCSQCYKDQKFKLNTCNSSPTYIVQQLRTTHI